MQQNVDPSEIQKFAELASRWWDKESEFKPLHEINPLRLSFIMEQCDGLFDLNVLDVGCGGGILSEAMAVAGANVCGIDMGEEPLEVAKLHSLETGVTVNYQQSTAEAFAQNNIEKFDVITCLEMLEHVPTPGSVIESCAKMVKPGGWVFLSTLNRNPKSYAMAILGAEYVLGLVPKGTHDYKKFIKPSELMKFTDQYGLICRNVTGLHYDPLNKTYNLSNSNIDVNYIAAFQKI